MKSWDPDEWKVVIKWVQMKSHKITSNYWKKKVEEQTLVTLKQWRQKGLTKKMSMNRFRGLLMKTE